MPKYQSDQTLKDESFNSLVNHGHLFASKITTDAMSIQILFLKKACEKQTD